MHPFELFLQQNYSLEDWNATDAFVETFQTITIPVKEGISQAVIRRQLAVSVSIGGSYYRRKEEWIQVAE